MPLPIKQYKHMFKDVKFLATTAQPSYKEVSHWIDLLEDPTGGTIKVWNGAGWKKISGEGDSDTGLVIGDTTGTAYDGGKGKELEDELDSFPTNLVLGTSNPGYDVISVSPNEYHVNISYWEKNRKTGRVMQAYNSINGATTKTAGVMSAADKQKLDNLHEPFFIDIHLIDKVSEEQFNQLYDLARDALSQIYVQTSSVTVFLMSASISNGDVHLLTPAIYNGFELSQESIMISHIDYSISITDNRIKLNDYGDGTKFLSDDGEYKKIDLSSKQDTLVSGTNIKTINGNSLLGEGNIEIQGGGEGIADAPSDGKKYVRQNANWVEETTVDTSNFATTAQLANKVDTSTYTEDKATFATKEELADKANTSDLSNYLTTTDAESNYAKKSEIPSLEGYLQTSTADEKYATKTELSGKADTSALASKQDTLVSGTNIKTINNQSLLGQGNIEIAAGDSQVYYLDLSRYFTNFGKSYNRYTGNISEEDISEIRNAVDQCKLIVGIISTESGYRLIPFTEVATSPIVMLMGDLTGYNLYLQINISTREYTGYYIGSSYNSDSSGTVTVSPLLNERIYIKSSSSSDLTSINVTAHSVHFRLFVTTSSQTVSLDIYGINGVIGATFTGSRIILEANSEYEIDVEDDVAVVAKINKPQAM